MRNTFVERLELRRLLASQYFFDVANANTGSGTNFANAPLLADTNAASVAAQLSTSQSQGKPLAVEVDAPLAANGAAISQVFNAFAVQYVLANLSTPAQVSTLVSQVKGTMSKNAFVGQFGYYPGDTADPTLVTKPSSSLYSAAAVNMANEDLLPGAADYRNPAAGNSTAPNIRSALFVLPVERLTLATNELYGRGSSLSQTNSGSATDASFPGGTESGKNVPYVSRFNDLGNTSLSNASVSGDPNAFVSSAPNPADGQLPSRGDFEAQILQYRLRGADSIDLLTPSMTDELGNAYSETQQQLDSNTGWFVEGQTGGVGNAVNGIFATHHYGFANLSNLVSLDTNRPNAAPVRSNSEATGIIYSGVYSEGPGATTPTVGAAAFRDKFGVLHPAVPASQLALLISNMSSTTETVDLGTIVGHRIFTPNDPNGTGQDDITIAPGTHRLVTFTLKNQTGLGLGTIAKQNANGLPVWDLTENELVFTANDRNGTGYGRATKPVLPVQPGVQVSSGSSRNPIAGADYTFVIAVKNQDTVAHDISVTDQLPSGTTFVSASEKSGPSAMFSTPMVGDTGSFSATIAAMPAQSVAFLLLTVHLDHALPRATRLKDTATATEDTDLGTLTASSSTSASVDTQADMVATLSSESMTPVVEGGDLVYTFQVSNDGPSDAQGAALLFTVPNTSGTAFNDTQFVSITQQDGPTFTLTPQPIGAPASQVTKVTGKLATLAAGATATFIITLHVPYFREITATAKVASNTFDNSLANNTSTDVHDVQDAALTTTLNPDISGITGNQLTLVAVQTFTDANGDAQGKFLNANGVTGIAQYSATIDWGDGSDTTPGTVVVQQDGTLVVLGTHTYESANTYTLHVIVTDGPSPVSNIVPSSCEAYDTVTIVDGGETF